MNKLSNGKNSFLIRTFYWRLIKESVTEFENIENL